MANTVPGTTPSPDVGLLMAGNVLGSAAVATLGQANNFACAHIGSGTPRILQAFPLRGTSNPGDAVAQYTTNAQNIVAEWRIPDTRGATSVKCYVYAKSAVGGVGEVEFKSVTGAAATGPQIIGASWDLYGPYTLTIDAGAGYETVRLYLDGNGDTLHLGAVFVYVPPVASPLASGTLASGCVAFDADELGTDEPLAAAQGARIIDNAATLRDVPHVYWNWSSLDYMPTDPLPDSMRSVPHIMPCVVWADTDREEWEITVHARASNFSGANKYVRVHASHGYNPAYTRTLELTVANGTAKGWVTGTLRLPSGRVARHMPAGWETVMLVVWPHMTEGDSYKEWERLEGGADGMTSSATVHSISAWGR